MLNKLAITCGAISAICILTIGALDGVQSFLASAALVSALAGVMIVNYPR